VKNIKSIWSMVIGVSLLSCCGRLCCGQLHSAAKAAVMPSSICAHMIAGDASLIVVLAAAQEDGGACRWSPEFDKITDPQVKERLGSNFSEQIADSARQAGGKQALAQQIELMKQQKSGALKAIQSAKLSQKRLGSTHVATQKECDEMHSSSSGTAASAAACEVLNQTNLLHFAQGSIDIMQCLMSHWE
jgi:hypothetical protein